MTGDRYGEARELVMGGKPSTSWLQRQMRIGYNEAARYIERMEAEGILSRPDAVGRRELMPDALAKRAANPWEGNEALFAQPSSGVPRPAPEPPSASRAPVAGRDQQLDAEDDHADTGIEAAFLAQEIADRFGMADLGGLIVAIEEARTLKEAAAEPEAPQPAAAHLAMIVERAEALIAQRRELNATLADVFAFAKAIGFAVPAIRACIKAREMEPETRKQLEAVTEVYRHSLGIEGPDFVIALPRPVIPGAAPARRLSKREKDVREVLALQHAQRASEGGGIFG